MIETSFKNKTKHYFDFEIYTYKDDKNILNLLVGSYLDNNGLEQNIYKTQIIKGSYSSIAQMLFKHQLSVIEHAKETANVYTGVNYINGSYTLTGSSTTAYIPTNSIYVGGGSGGTITSTTLPLTSMSGGFTSNINPYINHGLSYGYNYDDSSNRYMSLTTDYDNKPVLSFNKKGKIEYQILKAFNEIKANYIFE